MKLSVDFGSWTRTKVALAVVGALAFAGAIGSAVAMSPIIAPPIKWAGGAEFVVATPSGIQKLYTVPAGRSLLLTDLVVANNSPSNLSFGLYAASNGSCDVLSWVNRVGTTTVPFGTLPLVLAFQTGIGVGSGHAVCALTSSPTNITGRGFLFTPS